MTLVAGPVGAFDSASVPISSGEDADPGVCNAAAGAAAALRARNQGALRGIIAGGPTGWEEAALNGIAKEVVCSLYSIRSVKGPPGAWLVPVDAHKGAGLGLLAMGVTAISARPIGPAEGHTAAIICAPKVLGLTCASALGAQASRSTRAR